MKKSLFVSLFALMVLGACAPSMPVEVSGSNGAASSEEEKGPKDELFKLQEGEQHQEGGYLVTVPEYKDPLWIYSSKGTSVLDTNKFGTSVITNAFTSSWEFFASDMTKVG